MTIMSGRNGNGRFAVGNAGGPGRPPRRVEADYLAALTESVTIDDWKAIVTRAVVDAKNGNAKAREWLGKHLSPSNSNANKMNQPVELTNMTREEAVVLASLIMRNRQIIFGDNGTDSPGLVS